MIANFTADKTTIYQGEVVHFLDLTTGGPTFWIWEIDGGQPSINYQQNPVIMFNTVGEFNVKLTASNVNGQSVAIKEMYIKVLEEVSLYPPGWEVTVTSTQHIIAAPIQINPRVLEVPIQPGDFIGVFFTNTYGMLQCGGATMWDGSANIAIFAFGDQSFTPFKDGFAVNEVFKWKIYSYSHQRDFDATPSYDQSSPNKEKFFPFGISALTDLYSGILFDVAVPAGWSGISSPVMPFFTDLNNLMAAAEDNLTILYNSIGMYWPGQNINTLNQWLNTGYTIKMTAPDTITFGGQKIQTLTQVVKTGTGYLPVLSPCEVSTTTLFAPYLSKLILVRNILGTQVYWPEFGINTLPVLKPGNAYFVQAKSTFVVNFPQCNFKSGHADSQAYLPDFPNVSWDFTIPSPYLHTVALTESALGKLEKGDVIAIITPGNTCAGWSTFEGQPLAIPVYGNDPLTGQDDGFSENEPFRIKIFRPSSQMLYEVKPGYSTQLPDEGFFRTGGLSVIVSLKIVNDDTSFIRPFQNLTIFPNPGSGIFTITGLNSADILTITYPDSRLDNTTDVSGEQEFILDLTGKPKGVYLITVKGNSGTRTEKIVLQ